ncbi:hypothetical protein FRB91_005843, partial [Serendipita sp. 411]
MSTKVEDTADPVSTYNLWRLGCLAEATPSTMRELLSLKRWRTRMGELAIRVVELQLQIYDRNLKAAVQTISGSTNRVPSLMEAAARKLADSLEDDPEGLDVVMDISSLSIARALCSLQNIPYFV